MSAPIDTASPSSPQDTVDRIAGLATGSTVAALRGARAKVALHTQLSEAALFDPSLTALTLRERLYAAWYSAHLANAHTVAETYRQRLVETDAPSNELAAVTTGTHGILSRRLAAILDHARLLTLAPATAHATGLRTLQEAGLTTPAIVALSQLIAFVSYQLRVVAATRALQARADREVA
ncbi:CMD domain-containing protein [Paraburkholderia megapolitana]|uniref:N-terminal domain of uncharacterized protein YciW-containing protein n=1 Tax=Paraburkholderia megapolitana TaxID=420953 RepID=A0A1I3DIW9_9BURK|nr:hypothetical protein [Paraburkholderia megapolitana]QDQ81866.1 hypothetical protein FNZ07_12295 [Paraburkholderia megapolitana]SFH86529.1 N-terminal domain of uncharacterized protein YciW-containing protein [Paraburkholderia megapolitana]